jgi:hypothetical protein
MRFPRTALVVPVLAMVMLAMLAAPGAARAGGWAAVKLDSLPREPRAGQPLSLGFMVLQHGKTPVNFTQPLLSVRNRDSGETLSIEARQDGEVGHYLVEVAFPSAGTWDWEIAPRPFEATTFEPLAVLPPHPTPGPPHPRQPPPLS